MKGVGSDLAALLTSAVEEVERRRKTTQCFRECPLIALLILALVVGGIVLALVNASLAKADGVRQHQQWKRSTKETLGLADVAYGPVTLGINVDRRMLATIRRDGRGEWIPYDAVAGVELTPFYMRIDEGTSETTTHRGSQLIGAGLGAALAGPAGMIVGGLSGGSRTESFGSSSEFLSELELKIRLFSEQEPLLKLRFSVTELGQFDPVTKRLEGGPEDVERIAARLATELECRGPKKRATNAYRSFEQLTVATPTPVPKGWWQRTFG
jgi:hypothetical protein